MSMNLHGAHIQGGDFRAIYGDFHQHQISIQRDHNRVGIQALNKDISHGAMHDSAERDPPPRCHPGTREKATEDIVRWIDESNPSSNALWVNGRAGVGKTALMQKIAELGLIYLGGCFFFRRGTPGRNVKDHLFSTLAYQLAMKVPGLLELIDRAMVQDFSLPKKSSAVQLEHLIIEPIRLLPIPHRPIIIIIDGLDECEDFNSQRDILRLIAQVTLDPNIAIRFIIASRPEHQICEMFNKEPLLSKTRCLVLDDEEYDTAADIERYLRENFEEIHSSNEDTTTGVENPWPSEDDLEVLVWRASGQFIYAATVIKFVGSDMDFYTPQEKLEIILKRSPMQALAFSELDRLYTQILSLYPDPEFLVNILGMILALEKDDLWLRTPAFIGAITGFGEERVSRVLRALQSITEIHTEPVFDDSDDEYDDDEHNGTPIESVELSHRSFHDFLTDRVRSGLYFIDTDLFRGRIFLRILELATISIKELKGCGSLLPPINPDIWHQFELVFQEEAGRWHSWASSFKLELCLGLNNLRNVLFTGQPLLFEKLSKPFCAALIPTMQCVCSVLYLIRKYSLFNLPEKKDDPLQLDQFFTEARNLLDECYRQVTMTAGFIDGEISMLMPLMLDFTGGWRYQPEGPQPKTLRQIETITNFPDQQCLRRFINDSTLIHTEHINDGYVQYFLGYSISRWLCDFAFDPHRSRSLYSTSLVTGRCQRVIESFIANNHADSNGFFEQYNEISDATRLLEHAKNGSDSDDLLLFLQYLSEIQWVNIDTEALGKRNFTDTITHWVCTALESLSLTPGPLQDAMQKVLTAILPCGILPVLGQQISRTSELGFFEDQLETCLRCRLGEDNFPESPLSRDILQILPMCTRQIFFHALCTRFVESSLLGMVQKLYKSGYYLPHTCENGSPHSKGNSERELADLGFYFHLASEQSFRDNWGFAFTHASTSSKCILLAIRGLVQSNYFVERYWGNHAGWIVSEMIDWVKNQTVDPQPQDELIAWMEDAKKGFEKATATWQQGHDDAELQRSAEWASVIQRFQTTRLEYGH